MATPTVAGILRRLLGCQPDVQQAGVGVGGKGKKQGRGKKGSE